jgi:hypothetical protein
MMIITIGGKKVVVYGPGETDEVLKLHPAGIEYLESLKTKERDDSVDAVPD